MTTLNVLNSAVDSVFVYHLPVPLMVLIVLIIIFLRQYCRPDPPGMPNGPAGWPIIGHLALLDRKAPHETMLKWARKYGPIYKLRFGKELVVVLNDFESIKQAFCGKNGEAFSGRPNLVVTNEFSGGRHGIINTDGDKWREQRRFTQAVLREFGIGRAFMEKKIALEVDQLLDSLDVLCQSDQSTNGLDYSCFSLLLHNCVANIISSIVFGRVFPPNDPIFVDYQHRLRQMIQLAIRAQPVNYFPILQYIVPGGLGLAKFKEHMAAIRTRFIGQEIKQHEQQLKEDTKGLGQQEKEDFISVYLKHLKQTSESGSEFEKSCFNKTELESVVNDLFIAGLETTVNTLLWGILHMLHNPSVQRQIQLEMSLVLGDGVWPRWDDRNSLPFTQATIAEIQRLSNTTPFGAFHSTLSETGLGTDYRIPANTIVIANLYACHLDERTFPNPGTFRPQRFLDEVTNTFYVEGLIPFGLGKRACLGEALARMELFLIFTALLSRFNFSVIGDGQQPPPSLTPVFGATLSPQPFSVKVTPRKTDANANYWQRPCNSSGDSRRRGTTVF